MAPTEDLTKLREVFEEPAADDALRWEKLWANGVSPWDKGKIQPALRQLVEEDWAKVNGKSFKEELGGGRALVPGCGRGYDPVFFAQQGLEGVGIDISPTGIAAANAWLATVPDPPATVRLEVQDFFSFDAGQGFDIAYDYTFFCALSPSMRPAWGARYADIIKPAAFLIAFMYPIDGPREGGPPFSVSEDAYTEALSDKFDRIYSAVPQESDPARKGREVMTVWQRKQ